MDEKQQLVKDTLNLVKASGGTGVLRTKLMATVRKLDGSRLTPEEEDEIWCLIVGRNWITWHMEPIFHNKRWTLTDAGLTALEAM